MALLSMRQYAKHRGVSPEAVSKAVKRGRISTALDDKGQRKIDPEIADREWTINSDESKANFSPTADDKSNIETDKIGGNYRGARAVREAFNAKLAKLDFEQRSGKLVDAESVKKEAFKLARLTRDAVMSIADRISAEVAVETDPFKVSVRIREECRKALESLKDASVESDSHDIQSK
jgi:hypothetical protein